MSAESFEALKHKRSRLLWVGSCLNCGQKFSECICEFPDPKNWVREEEMK